MASSTGGSATRHSTPSSSATFQRVSTEIRFEWFTTAFFHRPDELRAEVEDAGLEFEALLGIEGLGSLLWERWDEPRGRENILYVARAAEQEKCLIGASAHLLVVARNPG